MTTTAPASTRPDETRLLARRLAEVEGENAALRAALAVRVEVANDLFRRARKLEYEHAWLVEAVRRAERLREDLESELEVVRQESEARAREADELRAQVAALSATRLFRYSAPARRVYGRLRTRTDR